MPIIEFYLAEGRTPEIKRNLCKAVTNSVVETLGVAPENVRILIRDVAAENFSIAGETVYYKK